MQNSEEKDNIKETEESTMKSNVKEKVKLPEVEKKNIHSIAYLTMLESPKRSMQATYIWLHLDARAGTNRYIWFDKEKIYNTLKISKDTYNNYLNELEYTGGIIQFKRFDKAEGGRESNIILVCEYDQFKDEFILPTNIAEIKASIYEKFNNKILIENVPVCPEERKKKKAEQRKKKAQEQTIQAQNQQDGGKPKFSLGVNIKFRHVGKRKISVYSHAKNSTYPPDKFYVYPQTENLASNNRNSIINTISINNTDVNKRNFVNHRKEENKRKDTPPYLSFPELWNNVVSMLRAKLSDVTIKTWILSLKPIEFENDTLKLSAPNDFTRGIAESKYGTMIEEALAAITGKNINVAVVDGTKA